ncbi:MAG: hypothetical protein J6S99_04960 [Bacteroidales bacterium]|nr:hypothetical protein [Bacteroidales bacterium]
MKKTLLIQSLLAMACSAALAQGTGGVPNPYTYFDVPKSAGEVALGLPKNDNSEKPELREPAVTVTYCAYRISNEGYPAKVFYDAVTKREYTVSFGVNPATGKQEILKELSIPDSLAIYKINDETKTITKIPTDALKAVAGTMTTTRTQNEAKVEIVPEAGRWCHMRRVIHTEDSGAWSETTYTDLETGIVILKDESGIKTYLRNIHLSNPYPEVFELPQGYKFVVNDMSKQVEMMSQLEGLLGRTSKEAGEASQNKVSHDDIEKAVNEGVNAFEGLLNNLRKK